MTAIKLLYAQNIISRRRGTPQQHLSFAVLVDNRAYEKQVALHWQGESGDWQTISAQYAYMAGKNIEVWRAQTQITASENVSLPGNVRFYAQAQIAGEAFTDNNYGQDYVIEADAGVMVPDPALKVVVLDHQPQLQANQKQVLITAVTNNIHHNTKRVYVRWTTNNWQTHHETPLTTRKTYWDRQQNSNGRNPNQYGTQVWTARIRVRDAYRLQYAICADTASDTFWDSNFEADYSMGRGRLKVMALNLHCYQEADQARKFRQIAKAIRDMDIDIICLQEVGENWNDGHGDWGSNSARIIKEHLPDGYHLYTDWSHIGFDRYREGVAILSRYPFVQNASGYVSSSHDVYSIHSRKVVMGQIDVPHMGKINVFSAHLSWWSDGFAEQFENLRHWASQQHGDHLIGTFLCGDFNIKAGSEGYAQVVHSEEYDDQYLKVTNRAQFDQVFRKRVGHWRDVLAHDGRIDYIWLKKNSGLKAVSATELFTDQNYGRVSDHTGYCVEFEMY